LYLEKRAELNLKFEKTKEIVKGKGELDTLKALEELNIPVEVIDKSALEIIALIDQ